MSEELLLSASFSLALARGAAHVPACAGGGWRARASDAGGIRRHDVVINSVSIVDKEADAAAGGDGAVRSKDEELRCRRRLALGNLDVP